MRTSLRVVQPSAGLSPQFQYLKASRVQPGQDGEGAAPGREVGLDPHHGPAREHRGRLSAPQQAGGRGGLPGAGAGDGAAHRPSGAPACETCRRSDQIAACLAELEHEYVTAVDDESVTADLDALPDELRELFPPLPGVHAFPCLLAGATTLRNLLSDNGISLPTASCRGPGPYAPTSGSGRTCGHRGTTMNHEHTSRNTCAGGTGRAFSPTAWLSCSRLAAETVPCTATRVGRASAGHPSRDAPPSSRTTPAHRHRPNAPRT